MSTFIPGLQLSQALHDAARPILFHHFPALSYSAGRLDYGSDVLGFDSERSMDHDWGPRLGLFVAEADFHLKENISHALGAELPFEILGHSTHYSRHSDQTLKSEATTNRPIQHAVTINTPQRWAKEYLGLEGLADPTLKDWMRLPWQRLRTLVSGQIFHDGLNALAPLRARLAWYPHDLWLYVMACQWQRVNQDEPFMARAGHAGDDLGSRLIAARLCNEIMRLAFLMEKQYPPYSKWFGSAFAQLSMAQALRAPIYSVLHAKDYQEREEQLGRAYLLLIQRHNSLSLTAHVEEKLAPFWHRPYLVPGSGRLVDALMAAIQDPQVKALPEKWGSVDQWIDSTDVLMRPERILKLGDLS